MVNAREREKNSHEMRNERRKGSKTEIIFITQQEIFIKSHATYDTYIHKRVILKRGKERRKKRVYLERDKFALVGDKLSKCTNYDGGKRV